MSSSFSPSLLSSSFNSSTDPKALDFGTLVAIEEVPKPSGFTAGAGAKDEKLERLKEMGFAQNAARAALGRAAGDEQQALELLLAGA